MKQFFSENTGILNDALISFIVIITAVGLAFVTTIFTIYKVDISYIRESEISSDSCSASASPAK